VEISREDVLSALNEAGSKGLKTKDIAHRLGLRSRDFKKLRSLLDQLESDGELICGRRRRYQLPEHAGFLKGRVFGYGRHAAVFSPSDGSDDLRVTGDNIKSSHHGDLVIARTVRGESGDKEAEVVRVLSQAPAEILGRIGAGRGGRKAQVDHDHLHKTIDLEGRSTARPGDHVLVKVGKWAGPSERTRGRVSRVLGGSSSPAEDFVRIVKEFNLPLSFPEGVEDEAGAIPDTLSEAEIKRREDLTSLLTFTIDPEDARDFDDAISVEKRGRGKLRVGVHIADVSHYVAQGSLLDKEAMARGSSVYLVGKAIPMLPEKLSSEMASLKPGVPRLAVTLFMDVDGHGEVKSYEIKESVIKSKARLTYEEAQHLLERGAGWRAGKQAKAMAEAVKLAGGLRATLKAKRARRGAIELETPEVDIVLDEEGKAIDARPALRLDAHNLIEELMILANETVAEHMSYLGRSFIYRVHEVPATEDMKDLAVFAAGLGHRFRWTKGTSPRTLQSLLDKVKGRPEEYVVTMFLLRSLKKAIYSERNVGHFGLASKCYTHFTSPIRRYPDLVVHRLLKRFGIRKISPRDRRAIGGFVRKAAELASIREMESDDAERASIKARIAEYMENRMGEEFTGVISGAKSFGFFVMLDENRVEGLVHVSNLGDDYYILDQTGTMLAGARGSGHFRVGDRVRVRVARVDRERREVDFELLEAEGRVIRPAARTRHDSKARKAKHHWESQESARKVKAGTERTGEKCPRPARSGRSRPGRSTSGRSRPGVRKSRKSTGSSRPRRPRKTGR
jgi:ribonuclease R